MTKKRIITILAMFAFLGTTGTALMFGSFASTSIRSLDVLTSQLNMSQYLPFPDIDESKLSKTQQRIVQVSRQEYAKKPVSYDENVLKYSNQVVEPWCADYISWVMREAGVPYINPNSGGWRIPGVLTLRQYYMDAGRFKDARGYTPQVGDAAIYVNTTSFNTTRQHVNIVLKVEGDMVTTIGGNERGRLRVNTQKLVYGEKGLVGYGTL